CFGLPQTAQRLRAGGIERFSRLPKSIGAPFRFGNMTPEAGLPLRSRCDSRRFANGPITGIAPRPFCVFGYVTCPRQCASYGLCLGRRSRLPTSSMRLPMSTATLIQRELHRSRAFDFLCPPRPVLRFAEGERIE